MSFEGVLLWHGFFLRIQREFHENTGPEPEENQWASKQFTHYEKDAYLGEQNHKWEGTSILILYLLPWISGGQRMKTRLVHWAVLFLPASLSYFLIPWFLYLFSIYHVLDTLEGARDKWQPSSKKESFGAQGLVNAVGILIKKSHIGTMSQVNVANIERKVWCYEDIWDLVKWALEKSLLHVWAKWCKGF